MRQCWNWDPDVRPTFSELVDYLDQIILSTSKEQYLEFDINVNLQTPPTSDDEFVNERMAMYP